MPDLDAALREKLSNVRLVVTDVDGVHTDDKVLISIVSDETKTAFGLEKAGATHRLVSCNGNGVPNERFLQLSTGNDGRIEGYHFFTGDGIAVKECLRAGIPVVLISGRKSPAVRQRAEDLGARSLQGIVDKVAAVEELLVELGLEWSNVLFIGNDIQDITLLRRAGFSAAPADAAPEAKDVADYITAKTGGNGVVREVLQALLEAKRLWENIVSRERTLG